MDEAGSKEMDRERRRGRVVRQNWEKRRKRDENERRMTIEFCFSLFRRPTVFLLLPECHSLSLPLPSQKEGIPVLLSLTRRDREKRDDRGNWHENGRHRGESS